MDAFDTFLAGLGTTAFWAALGQILVADILLSGDNAVVIALAARSLPPKQQKRAILLGGAGAIVMRVALTIVAVHLLQMPWLKLAGGLLLLWIGIGLMGEEEEEVHHESKPIGMAAAVRTIMIADFVMSLDNVLAVAAAAHGSTVMLVLGLAISIPFIVWGSQLLIGVMERFPILITAGAALLGWLAGETAATDPAIVSRLADLAGPVRIAAGVAGAVLVVAVGTWLERRRRRAKAA